MAKPYSIFKRGNGIFYAQFPFSVDGKAFQKSTGAKSRSEAEKVVLSWYMQGGVIPSHGNVKQTRTKSKSSLEKQTLIAQLRTLEFTEKERDEILDVLKKRNLILSAIVPKSKQSKSLADFLNEFWDFEKSPYVKEKLLKGQTIHKDYCLMRGSRTKTYWLPKLQNRELGSITRDDVKKIFNDAKVTKLAPKTINSIVASLTVPLKWAYYNDLTENNCFDGIIKCAGKSKQRKILTMEEAAAVFKADWENDSAKLANAVAMYTGMRQGEIAALRVQDIGIDRLYVRHSWARIDGLKCCKNGEEREVAIAPQLRDALLAQAALNPYGEGMEGFVFFGLKPSQPTDPKNWLKYLHHALESIGYKNPKEICFHSWRHLWCSRVCDLIGDKRVVMTGSGHKTQVMLDHYAGHIEQNNALHQITKAEEELFLPLLGDVGE